MQVAVRGQSRDPVVVLLRQNESAVKNHVETGRTTRVTAASLLLNIKSLSSRAAN